MLKLKRLIPKYIRVNVSEDTAGKLEITRDATDDFVWIKNCIDSSIQLYHLDICMAMISNYRNWHSEYDRYISDLERRIGDRLEEISRQINEKKIN